MRTLLFVLLVSFSFPAFAQSSLGITGATLYLGAIQDEAGDAQATAAFQLDVAITEFHGFQGDLAVSDTTSGLIGTSAAHLYMTPVSGQKYGLFAALSDVDGRAMIYGSVGAEGMLSWGDDTLVEGRAGMGWADVDGLDYIFAGASVAHSVSPALDFELALDLAEFDEATFSATSVDFGLTATFNPEGSPWGAYVSATHSSLVGRDDAAGAMRLGLGIQIALGTSGGTNPHTRPFRTVDPVAPLIRRGLW